MVAGSASPCVAHACHVPSPCSRSGDIVGVRGGIKRTEKGELSVMVTSLEVGRYMLLLPCMRLCRLRTSQAGEATVAVRA